MTCRRRPSVAAVLALLFAQAAEAAPTTRDQFVTDHLCAVRTRLTRIHQRGPHDTSRNRFLVVAIRGDPQSYVQCIFTDEDRTMLCEASSGVYRDRDDAGIRRHLRPDAVSALHRLGFSQPDPKRNFQRTVDLGMPPDLDIPARLILTALYDAYDGAGAQALDMHAPMAGGEPACGVASADRSETMRTM
ncbi:hypothetical protein MTDSW087_01109 [Methylobacterium dankookense]|uniref:TY-Chap N-terminal domain-containing protein n=1 Tax=Methylobacterium dankookense TaxID=560405 RepID=A0A564FTU5_9HYPH|nr:hypothetical protein IFDJLNFL_1872 [Methylobacterium dankookense]VUF11427.1 hypothetical protein MTDSW087_01109 [Methylobacterium dankookense]